MRHINSEALADTPLTTLRTRGTDPDMTEIQGHRAYTGVTTEGEAAVGRIAVWAARVEENLVDLCARLINVDDYSVGYAVTGKMSASVVIDLTRTLVTKSTSTSEDDRDHVLAMLREAKAALIQRNKILHSSVGEIMLGGKSVFSQRKKGTVPDGQNLVWESTLHGVDELDEIGARLFNVSEDLWAYVHLS